MPDAFDHQGDFLKPARLCPLRSAGLPVGRIHLKLPVAVGAGFDRGQLVGPDSKAHKDWLDAAYGSEEIDQRDLLFQQVGRLERIARKAENAGQFSAAVGAITALNRMMALGADQKGFRGHRTHPRRY